MHIGFFELKPHIRLRKQVEGLRKLGSHRITLVTMGCNWLSEYDGLFDKVIDFTPHVRHTLPARALRRVANVTSSERYSLPTRVLRKATNPLLDLDKRFLARVIHNLDCDIIHAYGRSNVLTQVVIENARVPVIYDVYDFAGVRWGVETLPIQERQAERFCLENVNGFVLKFPEEVLDYYRDLGYKVESPMLHYGDYCSEELMVPVDIRRSKPEEWHIVYAGNVAPASLPQEKYGYVQFHGMARMLAEQRIHFHVYATPYNSYRSRLFSCYRDLEKQVPYFHFHKPVSYRRLSHEICKYHWGAWIHPPVAYDLSKQAWYGVGNKIISYAEAGLPVVVNRELLFGSKVVQENQIGCVFAYDEIDRLGEILAGIDWIGAQINLEGFRIRYSIANQVERLMEFYQQVLTQAG